MEAWIAMHNIFCDNSVQNQPNSTLKKRNFSVFYGARNFNGATYAFSVREYTSYELFLNRENSNTV